MYVTQFFVWLHIWGNQVTYVSWWVLTWFPIPTMSKINFAASRPVNPPGATPRLSEAQVWKGLEIKARKPQDFIVAAESCTILSDSGNKVLGITYPQSGY